MSLKPRVRKIIFWIALASGFFTFFWQAQADTLVSGTISADQTWTAAEGPYIVPTEGVSVVSGATLTLEPGVVVKFQTNGQLINHVGSGWGGRIDARGTASQHIIFTSYADDTVGGDSNGDAGLSAPATGDWSRIGLASSDDTIQFAEIRYGSTCVDASSGSPRLTYNQINHCNKGISFGNATSTLVVENNVITQNAWGIYFGSTTGVAIRNNNIYGNFVYGAENFSGADTNIVDAKNNWWGDASGPHHATLNPGGLGDEITGKFIVENYLSQAVATSTDDTTDSGLPERGPLAQNAFPGQSSGQIERVAVPPKILKFESDLPSVKEGEEATLTWKTEGADFVMLLPEGEQDLNGSLKVRPDKTKIYELAILGPGGEVRAETTIEVRGRDPVIIVPGILGSSNDGGIFSLDRILHTYDGLWAGLRSVGYIPGETLFAFPYNWRNDNIETAKLLEQKINDVLRICGCQKVDVVAHSMGGLVARYYIQNINSQTIDQLIFLGTPQLGAPKAYLTWEAGEAGRGKDDIFIEMLIKSESLTHGYLHVATYVQNEVPSVGQLLPIYDYLSNKSTGESYSYGRCRDGLFTCNPFLEQLDKRQPKDYSGIRTYNIVSEAFLKTISGFSLADRESYSWIHGKPVNYPNEDGILFTNGDETVPIDSAKWGTKNPLMINSSHRDLPYQAQSEISKILINKPIDELQGTSLIRKIFFVGIHSPADIYVTDPNGKSYGAGFGDDGWVYYSGEDDPEFITIPDPIDGEYKINVRGTGQGHFEVETALLSDNLEVNKTFEGVINPDENYELAVNIAGDAVQEIKVVSSPPPPEVPVIPAPPSIPAEAGIHSLDSSVQADGNDNEVIDETNTTTPSSTLEEGEVKGLLTENTEAATKRKEAIILCVISILSILIIVGLAIYKLRNKK
ncbi:hypothetical protein D4R52_01700 [bacterium]|nr:MAG: hypothetical protein D4R52_01700 [bacterium]